MRTTIGTSGLGLAALLVWLVAAQAPAAQAGGDRDCSDFSNQAQAQDFFNSHNPSSDPHRLDDDNDGVACEANPCPCSSAGPGGGGGGGNDGHKTRKDRARVISVTDGDTIKVKLSDGRR